MKNRLELLKPIIEEREAFGKNDSELEKSDIDNFIDDQEKEILTNLNDKNNKERHIELISGSIFPLLYFLISCSFIMICIIKEIYPFNKYISISFSSLIIQNLLFSQVALTISGLMGIVTVYLCFKTVKNFRKSKITIYQYIYSCIGFTIFSLDIIIGNIVVYNNYKNIDSIMIERFNINFLETLFLVKCNLMIIFSILITIDLNHIIENLNIVNSCVKNFKNYSVLVLYYFITFSISFFLIKFVSFKFKLQQFEIVKEKLQFVILIILYFLTSLNIYIFTYLLKNSSISFKQTQSNTKYQAKFLIQKDILI